MSTVHTIETTTHGRYLVQAPTGAGPHPLIVGFHGYGENAAVHLDVLKRTVGDRPWVIVSVQALSRFYTRGERRVIASWMTREDRELAIADNIAYGRRIVDAVHESYDVRRPLVYAGFSQGVAMAYRAAAFGRAADGLLLLAGDLPPDVHPSSASWPRTFIGRGTADEWYTREKADADVARFREADIAVETHVFDAGHDWTDEFADAGRQFLDRLTRA